MRVPLTSVIIGSNHPAVGSTRGPDRGDDRRGPPLGARAGLVNDMLTSGACSRARCPQSAGVRHGRGGRSLPGTARPPLQEKQIRVERHFHQRQRRAAQFADRQKSERVPPISSLTPLKFTPTEGRVDVRLIPAGEQFLPHRGVDSGPASPPMSKSASSTASTKPRQAPNPKGSGLGLHSRWQELQGDGSGRACREREVLVHASHRAGGRAHHPDAEEALCKRPSNTETPAR